MEKVHVSIDGSVSIPALIDPDDDWNGFVRPWFDAKDVPLIQKMLDAVGGGEVIIYDADSDKYGITSEEYEEWYKGADIEGQHLYPIGAGSWVWLTDD